MVDLHDVDDATRRALQTVYADASARLCREPDLGGTVSPEVIVPALAGTITEAGLGFADAWQRFLTVVDAHRIALDSPRFLAFISAAPAPLAAAFDAVVSAASYSAESWLEAAGPVAAENAALSWLASLASLPAEAGGCFVSGGTAGNFSALAVAREHHGPHARRVLVGAKAHSSVAAALRLLRLEPVVVPEEGERLTGAALHRRLLGEDDPSDICAVVAAAGATNDGSIDDLTGIADVARSHRIWLHVDGAYGGAALCVPELRPAFDGIEWADSLIIDPHKWLFGPLDCCALLYRDPAAARAVHTQHAPYLEALHGDGGWNPADHAFHLTRRARGLPLWFTLAVYGTAAFRTSVRAAVDLARWTASEIRRRGAPLSVVTEPALSIVLFRRDDWALDDWAAWSRSLLTDGIAFVTPTRYRGEVVGRLAFLHPSTTRDTVAAVLDRAG